MSDLTLLKANPLQSLQLTKDVEKTLKYLIKEGTPQNSLRAIRSDLNYIAEWYFLICGDPLPWPAPPSLYMTFIAHHLFFADERQRDPSHGMPLELDEMMVSMSLKKEQGPLSPSTVKRRIATWNTSHKVRNLIAPSIANPIIQKTLASAIKAAKYIPKKKSPKAIRLNDLNKMLETCSSGSNTDIRDGAILAVMFASGGRRRAEMCEMLREDVRKVGQGSYFINLRHTKTTSEADQVEVYVTGRAGGFLESWLKVSPHLKGPLFFRIRRYDILPDKLDKLHPDTINHIIKKRAVGAGIVDVDNDTGIIPVSAHGMRSGFLSECADQNIPIQSAMANSLHKTPSIAMRYYEDKSKDKNPATRIMDE